MKDSVKFYNRFKSERLHLMFSVCLTGNNNILTLKNNKIEKRKGRGFYGASLIA
jgi:hypothetical protein